LILRLYEPRQGTIHIDDNDIRDLPLKFLREKIAFVPQDTFLFSETIKENIMFGNPKAQKEDVERVSRIAEIHHEIMAFPRGFDTVVGERGITLSGGQKQRIALARALLLDCPILILDDAFSSVDAETERKILSNLKEEMKGRTAIVITHRIFAIQDATRIIVIDKGRIAEQGTHRELVRQKGVYRSIFNTQQIEMKLEAL
jgi:ATP-binding cassette subfamily B protein